MSRRSSVNTELGHGLDDWGSTDRGNDGIFFSSSPRPYRHWGPSSLLSNGYRGL